MSQPSRKSLTVRLGFPVSQRGIEMLMKRDPCETAGTESVQNAVALVTVVQLVRLVETQIV